MSVTGKALLAGVMGWPVAHSRSPLLHGYWLKHYGTSYWNMATCLGYCAYSNSWYWKKTSWNYQIICMR